MSTLKTRFAQKTARSLMANMTTAERTLSSQIRDRRLLGFKFVRQLPVGQFIADFACRDADLVIELDGGQHSDHAKDEQRTAVLAEHGYQVVRFWNHDVLTNVDGVLETIAEHLAKAPSPGLRFAKPDLSPEGRGEVGPAHKQGNSP